MVCGYMISQAISTAAQLGVANLLRDGARGADDLAKATATNARMLYRILRALASVGVFAENADGKFELTPLAESLRSDAPDSIRDFAIFMGANWHWQPWGELLHSVKTGQPAFEHLHGKPFFDYLAETPEPARAFDNAMTSLSSAVSAAAVEAYDFSSIKRLVDVGGGHGFFLASILKKYPQMQGVLFDAPQVVSGARELLSKYGVESRCEIAGGDFFEAVATGGDAYIMKHIIHDWNDERALKIMKNCHRAMQEGDKLLLVEMVIPEGNAPSFGKFLDLEMMVFMGSFERTREEYRKLYEQSGFELTLVVPTNSPYSVIEGVRV